MDNGNKTGKTEMKRHPFSMVEILLALGVVAIGICSVSRMILQPMIRPLFAISQIVLPAKAQISST